jgi:hypothetical protein
METASHERRVGRGLRRHRARPASWRLAVLSVGLALWACGPLRAAEGAAEKRAAPPVRVEASAEPRQVTIGDVITFTVRVTAPKGMQVELPGLEADLSPFEVRDYQETPARHASGGGGYSTTATYKLAVFEVGDLHIPAVGVKWATRSGEQGAEQTEPVPITVASVLRGKVDDIRDIKGPLDVARGHLAEVIVAVMAVAAIAVLLILGVWARRRQPAKPEEPAEPPLPADVVALQRLEALAASALLAQGRVKQYYTELSDIVRGYIEARYAVPALERTTHEVLRDLRPASLGDAPLHSLEALLSDCDFVKFAKWRPDREAAEAALAAAVGFVEATRPTLALAPAE